MSEQPDSLILRYLRRIDANVQELCNDVREVKPRVGLLEQQDASLPNRVDRIEVRIDRLEKRLERAYA